jgi:hypothetical protein
VSPVVAVVISFVAAPPRVRAQPPKVYPLRLLVVVLDSDSVESRRESAETLVAVSVAGTEVVKVLPSKTIVGLAAVVAEAGAPRPNTPEIDKETIAATAIGLLCILV